MQTVVADAVERADGVDTVIMRVTAWVATWHAAFIDLETVGTIVGTEAGNTGTGVTAVGILTNRIGTTNVGVAFVDV